MASHYFRGRRDYASAQREIALARPGLPNSPPFFVLAGYIERWLGQWQEAKRDFESAVKLDPRNPNAVNLLADTSILLRQYDAAIATYVQAIGAGLDSPIIRFRKESIPFSAGGDPEALRAALAQAPPDLDVGGGETSLRILLAMIAHDYDSASRALAASPREEFQEVDFSFYYPRSWYEAIIARARADGPKAKAAFTATRKILEQRLAIKPANARTLAVLAQVDAGLGEKARALEEARHAVELMPVARDAYDGVLVLQGLAQVYTWTGENEQAIDLLDRLLQMPGYLCYGYLRVDPSWDPLRADPRFREVLAKSQSASRKK